MNLLKVFPKMLKLSKAFIFKVVDNRITWKCRIMIFMYPEEKFSKLIL